MSGWFGEQHHAVPMEKSATIAEETLRIGEFRNNRECPHHVHLMRSSQPH
jgi:hypothetical protein